MRIAAKLADNLCADGIVKQGPFTGRKFLRETTYIPSRSLILGTYEKDLWRYIAGARSECDGAVVVGAAEGYYAIGLATGDRAIRVVAFEMDPAGRELLRRNIEINLAGGQIEVRGECEPSTLGESVRQFSRPFLVMDVEGAEGTLLLHTTDNLLDAVTILVEIHDFVDATLGDRLRARFEGTHILEEIWQKERQPSDLPASLLLRHMLWRWYSFVVCERRPERMRWFYMIPRKPIESRAV